MSEIAQTLLSQYYGVGKTAETGKSISIHECFRFTEQEDNLLPTQSSVDANDTACKQGGIEEESINYEKKNSVNDIYVRSSRVLEEDTSEDERTDVDQPDAFFLPNNIIADQQDVKLSPAKHSSSNKIKTACETLDDVIGAEQITDTDSNLIPIDNLQDSASDISSLTIKKKRRKSVKASKQTSSSPQLPRKQPLCNGTFMDLSSFSLNTFSMVMVNKTPNLQMLYLENNNLTELPGELFSYLRKLEWLDVRNNQLTTLPVDIKFHPSLKTILLQGNKCAELPLELCTLSQLKTLLVAHNPLVVPPEDVISQGFPSIMNFLRDEWNKLHPKEFVKPPEDEMQQNISTILCHRSPQGDLRTKSRSMNLDIQKELSQFLKRSASRQKRMLYRPNNRCESSGINILADQQRLCTSKVKEMLSNQAMMLQKIKDQVAIKEWRQDKRSFNISMEKAAKRDKYDIPFGTDMEEPESTAKVKQSGKKKRQKLKFTPPTDINAKIGELHESVNALQITNGAFTPKSEQKALKNEIEKIMALQNEIQYIKQCNDANMMFTGKTGNQITSSSL